ncbi:MAG: T9SS type A sorting domain-containing protein [Flavobacteriaceae bacterium]|nr:T9SS type A sorting domain-containing protein [Flavobacteriaceae bacterium]
MKPKFYPQTLRYVFVAILCSILSFNVNGQQLKTSHDPKANKGHQLYKQTKIYDNSAKAGSETKPQPVGDKASDRVDYEFNRLKNPYTGKIPKHIKELEAEFSKTIENTNELQKSIGNAKSHRYSYWKNRGPYNVGGRTRALAIDRYNENIIFAGGVSGGLWRSGNAGDTWRKVTRSRQSPSITDIVQDPRPHKRHIWYYSSGERSGNSASGGGAFFTGTGVYKSTNYGYSWRLLRATKDNDITTTSPFEITNSIAVNPTNGDLYVATFNGVHRSKDGGRTFEEVLAGGFDSWTEVIITPSGQIYATVDFFGDPNTGFFTSTDGDTWTNITPTTIPGFFNGRTVMAYDPSDENIVYFFSENLLAATTPFLLKYNAAATIPVEQWTNLSANLPIAIGGPVGSLNLQGRFNMFIKVKPDDSNFIVLGGTNLYRSTTGFTTPSGQENWIGGYSPINNVSVYPDQHPDQHDLIFYPSNPNKVLSANDGGVHTTEDITTTLSATEPVDWTSLNNGYLTTQSYAVSFDPQANSDDLVSGFQDNGTWFTNSTNTKEPWVEDFGGDGSYNAIADGGNTRYISSQFANILRLNFDDAGNFVSFARIRPAIAANPGFIAPFILDPNNDNIMYLPDGNRILRNNDLDEVPGGTFAFATVNWVALPQSATPAGSRVTALDVSRFPEANRLYYGSNTGVIMRMDNANLDNQQAVDISTGKGLPPGFVSNISVDPSNSDRVMVAFSNYGIPSLFITEDAGETWTNISGNLEENADGTGNGPSVRWAAFFGNGQGYFAATSTGLYYAFRLRGNRTRWFKEPFRIGNAVIAQVKTRKDGFIALATHGNGLYSAKFPIFPWNKIPEPNLSVAYLLDDLLVDENSADTTVDITDLFVSSSNASIDLELTNSNPDLVTATLNGNTILLSYTPDSVGSTTIGIIATSGNETVAEGFTIIVKEPAIYEQVDPIVGSSPSQLFTDFNGLVQSADDFVIPDGSVWTINRVLAFGGVNGAPVLDNATVVIYADDNGSPGAEVFNSGTIVPLSDTDDANLNLPFAQTAELESGTYWLAVYENSPFNPGGNQWFWSSQAAVNGQESHFKDDINLFGTGAVDWTPTSIAFGRIPADQVFQIFGVSSDASSNNNQNESVLATLDTRIATVAWPNPSIDQFNFNIEALGKGKASIRIYNLNGQLVYQKDNLLSNKTFTWNASTASAGIYLVSIKGKDFNYNGKLVKQ